MITLGNKKLAKNCMIFNLRPAIECPADKLGLCPHSKDCYAKRDERQYPSTQSFRYRQENFYSAMSVEKIVGFFIGMIYTKDGNKFPITEIRFSEAGDFLNQDEVNKFTDVFTSMKENFPNIRIYGYTARKDLNFANMVKVAVVNGSNAMISNHYKIVDKIDKSKPYCNGDCTKCNLCKIERGITIQVKLNKRGRE